MNRKKVTSYIKYVDKEKKTVTRKKNKEKKYKKPGKLSTSSTKHENNKSELSKIIDYLKTRIDNDNDLNEIESALCNVKEGLQLFTDLSCENPAYSDSRSIQKKFQELKDNYDKAKNSDKKSLGTLYYIAYSKGYKNFQFYKKNKKNKVELFYNQIILKILPALGFFRLDIDYIKLSNNIITRVSIDDIKASVKDYINDLLNETEDIKNLILEKIFRNDRKLYSKSLLSYLPIFSNPVLRDSADTIHFFFQNGWIKVKKGFYSKKIFDYTQLPAAIFKEQIIEHNFSFDDEKEGDFDKFIVNITCDNRGNSWKKNDEKYFSLVTAIGYLLSDHKNPANAKAIILMDEIREQEISNESNGGTGKSLIGLALSKVRKLCLVDGKTANPKSNFFLQQVDILDKILYFDDIKRNFDFEKLFAIITGDAVIEKKFLSPSKIAFEDFAKILISTNRITGKSGYSASRRKFEVALNHYYGKKQPIDDFKKLFFEEWDNTEYNMFYNFMVYSAEIYLDEGLIEFDFNSDYKQILERTSPAFVKFAEEKISENNKYDKVVLYDQFIDDNPIYRNMLSKIKFKKWIDEYASFNDLKTKHNKSNGKSIVTLFNNEEPRLPV